MNLAVITCAAYSDAWPAFFGLLSKFWPDHPKIHLLTDYIDKSDWRKLHDHDLIHAGEGKSWCDVLRYYVANTDENFVLMQEDFTLSAPVRTEALKNAEEILNEYRAGCFRVYPCPGAPETSSYYVPSCAAYRISCQAAIWKPSYLRRLLRNMPSAKSAADFELQGSEVSRYIDGDVMSCHRLENPWPIEYICSAITRGKWNPDAKKLCDQHGIEVDWTRREFAA